MKTFVRVLIPLVLILVAVPSFAACGYCDFNCNCVDQHGLGTRCKLTRDCCTEIPALCATAANAAPSMIASEYAIASIEIVTPAGRSTQAPAAQVAEARTGNTVPNTR